MYLTEEITEFTKVFLHKYIRIQLFEAIVKSAKSRFQTTKTMFKHGIHMLFEHSLNWKSPRRLHDVRRQNVEARNEHFAYAFLTSMLIAEMTSLTFYVANQRHFLQWDTVCWWRNTIILITFRHFGVILDWNQVKCKTNEKKDNKQCLSDTPAGQWRKLISRIQRPYKMAKLFNRTNFFWHDTSSRTCSIYLCC